MTDLDRVLASFDHGHLPDELQRVSRLFSDLAHHLAETLPTDDPELLVGLRKLLESKDCCVRVKVAEVKARA